MSKRRLTTDDVQVATDGPSRRVKFDAKPAAAKGRAGTKQGNAAGDGHDDVDVDAEDLAGGKQRRGAVQLDGYDSDSSAGSDTGPRRTKEGATTDGQDEDDMFASKGGDDKGLDVKQAGKRKEFLELGDIEGQEFGKGGNDDDDDDDDEDGDDFDEDEEFVVGDERANDDEAPRARRKSEKGMGFTLSQFNMAEELSQGRFTADGTYVVATSDPQATFDSWLKGVDNKKEIKKARKAKKLFDEQQRQKAATEDTLAASRTRDECLIAVLGLLRFDESISHALVRLGTEKKRQSAASSSSSSQRGSKKIYARQASTTLAQVEARDEKLRSMEDSMQLDEETSHQIVKPAASPSKTRLDPIDQKIADLTDLASALFGTHNESETYDLTHSAIVKMLRSEGAVRRDWNPPVDVTSPTTSQSSSTNNVKNNAKQPLIVRPSTTTDVRKPSIISHDTTKYYFRYFNSSQEYGPHTRTEMETWSNGGFWGVQACNVQVRKDRQVDWTTWALASQL